MNVDTMRRRRNFYLILVVIVITSTTSCFVFVTSSSVTLHGHGPHGPHGVAYLQQGYNLEVPSASFDSKRVSLQNYRRILSDNKGTSTSDRRLSRLGSRPPNCKSKCGGCIPCYATQIPTTTDQLNLQYANYEPEGWKCQCGATPFNP